MNIFDDAEAQEHFELIKESNFNFRELVDGPTEGTKREEAPPKKTVPQHLKAHKVDDRMQMPVRLHGVEGDRDASKPFRPTNSWHLEIGSDGRPMVAAGPQTSGMKLSWDDELGCILVPWEEKTVLPRFKPLGQGHYPGERQ